MVLLEPPAPAARADEGRAAAGARRLREGRVVMSEERGGTRAGGIGSMKSSSVLRGVE
jgi:hypothetical protein